MGIEDRVLKKLDFHKVLKRLADYCLLPRAQEIALNLTPYTDEESVRLALEETNEGKEILRGNPLFSVRGAKEIRPYLERCLRGGTLAPDEFLDIRDTLKTGRQIRQFFAEEKGEFPRLRDIVAPIIPEKGLEEEITRSISEDGTVSDSASSELAELRRAKIRLQQRIRDSLEGILRNPAYQKMLQESLITQRADRYVVPVKQEYRSAFPGIVHDQSASGATLFIEPMPVVHLGNELREVIVKEQREVQRILFKLSAMIGGKAETLGDLYESLARLDFALGKAHLSGEMNAGTPQLQAKLVIKLVQARHPLLTGSVVPLSVELGTGFDMVIVTGPNTGGKTVALKTMGLLTVMTQAGLHIPAESDSRMGVFTRVFVDIGDEQSVEQSLSTFSGHMKNIIEIVNKADGRSLVLLDEIGAGTDPTEGAALAMAILAGLHQRGCRTVATTHYGALKTFAYQTPQVENASVEFDAETLRPTYRLLVGVPGKSNAFYIAKRLGLAEDILAKARNFLTEREMQVADLIENLEDTQREIESERRRVEIERKAAERQSRELAEKTVRLDEEYQDMMARAKDQATEFLQQVRREAENLISEFKEELKKERKDQEAIQRARQGIKRLSAKIGEDERASSPITGGLSPDKIKLGQTVYMTKLRQKGQVLTLPNENGEVLVQAGVLKVNVSLSDLRPVAEQAVSVPRTSGEGRLGRNKAESVRSEIDLRGMTVEEANQALDKYLDNAVLSGINQIYIIHGKGTGVLRAGIQDFLKGHPHVRAFRLGRHGEGDLGVTVAELK